MFKKALKKILCATLALGSVVASAATFAGCTTDRPEAEIKIEFNDKTYTLEYTLYRKIAPATVSHFIKLADGGYYKNMLVHDYADSKMYTGGYEYKADDLAGSLALNYEKDYFATVAGYKNFPITVWDDENRKEPTYTLYGEFSKNNFQVENGALKQSYGALTMYYTPKDTEETVTIKRADGDGYTNGKGYEYNSATSLFSINLSTTETSNTSYCTFAKLSSDSKSTLEKLQKAIASYINTLGTEEDAENEFTESVTVYVNE
ncbi:MAG: peptidylprolyl isomerase, partial [Clostridia bacterium]|nr:peptidylprolyl isomerase [Clostridia bacterium]